MYHNYKQSNIMTIENLLRNNPNLTAKEILDLFDKQNNPPITNEIKSFISELKVDDYYSDSEMNDLEIIFRIKEINHYNMVVESLIIYKYKKLPNLKYNEHHVIQFNDLFNNGNNLIKIEKDLFNTKINSLKYLNQKYDNEIKNKQEIEFEDFETIKEVSDYMRLNPNILGKNVINSFKTYIREEYKREEIIFKNNLKLIQIGTVLTRFGDLYKVGDMDYDACYLIGITSTENQTRIFEISESKDDVIKFYSIVKNIDFDSLKQEILDFKLI